MKKLDISDLLITTNNQGVYIKTHRFQSVQDALHRDFVHLLTDELEVSVHSPGLIPRRDLERSSYLDKFPQFVARVTPELKAVDADDPSALSTLPSACLCLYPLFENRTIDREHGVLAGVTAACFRNEAGYGPERMRSFTMSEYVFFGRPEQTTPFRDRLVERVKDWMARLWLDGRIANANDPFFGRLGELLAEKQRAHQMKLELLLPVSEETEVACFSFNEHREFFGTRWNISMPDGAPAHSACVGVGLERLALALFHRHGADTAQWPSAVRAGLGL